MASANDIFIHSILASMMFKAFQIFASDRTLTLLINKKAYHSYLKNKVDDDDLEDTGAANGTAWIHSLIAAPICLYEAIRLWNDDDIFTGESKIIEYLGRLMMGYFLWDCYESWSNLDIHGYGYLIHALGAYLGILFQLLSPGDKLLGVVSLIGASEISTIFLHYRWILIKSKSTNTWNFKVVNYLFMAVFFSYRIVFLPVIVFPTIINELVYMPHGYDITDKRRYLLLTLIFINIALNGFWASKAFVTLFKKRGPKPQESTTSEKKTQ